MDEIGLMCAGSLTSRQESIKWLKKQNRNAKWNLDKKKQIQKALNMAQNMTDEEYRKCVDSYMVKVFYANNIWD